MILAGWVLECKPQNVTSFGSKRPNLQALHVRSRNYIVRVLFRVEQGDPNLENYPHSCGLEPQGFKESCWSPELSPAGLEVGDKTDFREHRWCDRLTSHTFLEPMPRRRSSSLWLGSTDFQDPFNPEDSIELEPKA